MCCNSQKAARARLVKSSGLRLMPPPRTACGCTESVANVRRSRPSVLKSKIIRLDTGCRTPRLRRHREMAARAPLRGRAPRHPLMPAPLARHQPPWFARQRRRVQHTLGRPAVQSLYHRAAGRIGRRRSECASAAYGPLITRFQGTHRRTWPSKPGRSRRSGAPEVLRRADSETPMYLGLAGQCRTASVGEETVDRDRCGLVSIHATTPRIALAAAPPLHPFRRVI